jgi:hypothetical protein
VQRKRMSGDASPLSEFGTRTSYTALAPVHPQRDLLALPRVRFRLLERQRSRTGVLGDGPRSANNRARLIAERFTA